MGHLQYYPNAGVTKQHISAIRAEMGKELILVNGVGSYQLARDVHQTRETELITAFKECDGKLNEQIQKKYEVPASELKGAAWRHAFKSARKSIPRGLAAGALIAITWPFSLLTPNKEFKNARNFLPLSASSFISPRETGLYAREDAGNESIAMRRFIYYADKIPETLSARRFNKLRASVTAIAYYAGFFVAPVVSSTLAAVAFGTPVVYAAVKGWQKGYSFGEEVKRDELTPGYWKAYMKFCDAAEDLSGWQEMGREHEALNKLYNSLGCIERNLDFNRDLSLSSQGLLDEFRHALGHNAGQEMFEKLALPCIQQAAEARHCRMGG